MGRSLFVCWHCPLFWNSHWDPSVPPVGRPHIDIQSPLRICRLDESHWRAGTSKYKVIGCDQRFSKELKLGDEKLSAQKLDNFTCLEVESRKLNQIWIEAKAAWSNAWLKIPSCRIFLYAHIVLINCLDYIMFTVISSQIEGQSGRNYNNNGVSPLSANFEA